MIYLLNNCTDPNLSTYVTGDLSSYVGKVIQLPEDTTCYAVVGTVILSREDYPEAPFQEVVDPPVWFNDCTSCNKVLYSLTDCDSKYGIKYTDEDLSEYVGSVIKIPFYRNSCFTVGTVINDGTVVYSPIPGEYTVHENCVFCRTQAAVAPKLGINICDPAEVIEIKCSFAEMMYQQIESKRLGIDFCCQLDKAKWTIKNIILNGDLLLDPDPELPEPFVESCCIQQDTTCLPTRCTTCPEETEEEVDCNCTASVDRPHDCHTYTVVVTQPDIDAATGNDLSWQNGTVFFSYFKCKETSPTTINITELSTQEVCVLGIPAFGYFADNVWVELLTATRGDVCEPPVENTCCDGI